jgi:ATP-dependent RNA helicase DHX8/PRP22
MTKPDKKKKTPLTPVERMEDMATTSTVSEALAPHLNGVQDKTLSEFIIHLTEQQIKKAIKAHSAGDLVANAQGLRQRISDQGAPEIPLSLCSRLFELVQNQSPRIKRWKTAQMEKQQAAKVSSGASTSTSKLSSSFPGLAGPNLKGAVPLEESFHEYDVKKEESSKRRGISNLPAWMKHDAQEEPSRKRPRNGDGEMELYEIYTGRVSKSLDFGVRVELDNGKEGMVYKAQLPKDYEKGDLKQGTRVYVKLISQTSNKLTFSIKDVDQKSGRDIMPHRNLAAAELASSGKSDTTATQSALSSTAVVHPGLDVAAVKRQQAEDEAKSAFLRAQAGGNSMSGSSGGRRQTAATKLTEQELFEAQQLVRSGVLPVEQYPTYDPEMGMLAIEETEEETEVELADVEPAFLRGQTKRSGRKDLEPVKIIKNPDGSLQRAAMQQANMAKERRELRQAQANQLIDSIPKDLNRPWEDPLPEAGERHFAQELRSINIMSQMDGAPEWKQKAESKTLSYGIVSNKSIKEQRESLPIYKLKRELMQAMTDNQVLVVIGETGSGKTVCSCAMRLSTTHQSVSAILTPFLFSFHCCRHK